VLGRIERVAMHSGRMSDSTTADSSGPPKEPLQAVVRFGVKASLGRSKRHVTCWWRLMTAVSEAGGTQSGPFVDRPRAGRALAAALADYAGRNDTVVLALPRGGILVSLEVARDLGAPLDVFVVRELAVPGHRELAMGTLAPGGLCVLNNDVVQSFGITKKDVLDATRAENQELGRRNRAYRGDRAPADVSGKVAILVDDGLTPTSTMRVAVQALRQRGPARVVAAAPFAAPETISEVAGVADEMICAVTPEPFDAVELGYEDFAEASDDEVRSLLDAARRDHEQRQLNPAASVWAR
jgi:putative phosphoribosyl transferase